jgi:hypothetical protein
MKVSTTALEVGANKRKEKRRKESRALEQQAQGTHTET